MKFVSVLALIFISMITLATSRRRRQGTVADGATCAVDADCANSANGSTCVALVCAQPQASTSTRRRRYR